MAGREFSPASTAPASALSSQSGQGWPSVVHDPAHAVRAPPATAPSQKARVAKSPAEPSTDLPRRLARSGPGGVGNTCRLPSSRGE